MYSITPKNKDNCSNRRQLIVTSCEGSSKECHQNSCVAPSMAKKR